MPVKYKEIGAELWMEGSELGVDNALELLGAEAVNGKTDYHLRVGSGKEARRLKFANCLRTGGGKLSGNRPFRIGLAKRYRDEILRKKWAMNGESIIIDSHGKVNSGQHRLAGLILAEEARKANPSYYRDQYGWKGPITIPALIVTGVDPASADTVDIGQKRSAGDVLFRRYEFGGNLPKRDAKKLSRILGEAVRLVWIRTGGKLVSDAPYFLHSVMLDEVAKHPELKESVKAMLTEETNSPGNGEEDKRAMRISQYISLSYAAALHYLFATSATDREAWAELNCDPNSVDFTMQEKADEFFSKLGLISDMAGEGVDKYSDAPVIELAKEILKRKGTDAQLSRDAKVAMFIKTWQIWNGEESGKVKLTRNELADLGSLRIGGLDTVVEPEPEEEEVQEEKPKRKPRKKASNSKAGKSQKAKAESEDPKEEESADAVETEEAEAIGAEA